jgi:hypothetical protein
MEWYETWFSRSIKKVTVDRFNDTSVWVNGRRHRRFSNTGSFFPTLDEAKTHLMKKSFDKIERAKKAIALEEDKIKEIKKIDL